MTQNLKEDSQLENLSKKQQDTGTKGHKHHGIRLVK